ncbi:MAG: hypothetical protein RIC12_00905 [Pirellulales bacterium]
MDSQRKADEKRSRRVEKQRASGRSGETPKSSLTLAEQSVLSVFRNYLMTPGKMLCLGSSDLEAYKPALSQLMSNGLLIEEARHGSYSLTDAGFAAMKDYE